MSIISVLISAIMVGFLAVQSATMVHNSFRANVTQQILTDIDTFVIEQRTTCNTITVPQSPYNQHNWSVTAIETIGTTKYLVVQIEANIHGPKTYKRPFTQNCITKEKKGEDDDHK